MSTIGILGIAFAGVFVWSLIGLMALALLEDELKGRSLLAHIVVFASGPIVPLLFTIIYPFVAAVNLYRDNQKPPKQIYIDPAIREAAKWLEVEKEVARVRQQAVRKEE